MANINETWLRSAETAISEAKKGLKGKRVTLTMAANLGANAVVDEASRTICNPEAKLYEQTMAALTVKEELDPKFRKLYVAATEKNFVPTAAVDRVYQATLALLEAEKTYADEIRSMTDAE